MKHLHLGAGALGLGLICPSTALAGHDCYVLNRPGSANRRIAAISRDGGYVVSPYLNSQLTIPMAGCDTYGSTAFDGVWASQEDLLVTTALKRHGLEESTDEIARILLLRPAGSRTVVIAGENQVDSHFLRDLLWRQLDDCKGEIQFPRVVVDRICNKPTMTNGSVDVATEGFGRIYVESYPGCPAWLKALCKGDLWEQVPDINYVVNRKKWLVNAAHLGTSLAAHYYRFDSVFELCDYPWGRNLLHGLIAELVHITAFNCAERQDEQAGLRAALAPFAAELEERISSFPQRLYDGVTRFTGEPSLYAFFEDYHRKIVGPFIPYSQSRQTAPYFVSTINAWTIQMIVERKWIEDVPRVH